MDTLILIKIVSAMLYPVGLIASLFALRWVFRAFSWRWMSRICAFAVIAIFTLGSSPQLANWLVASLEQEYPQLPLNDISPADAIIVLGGGLRIPTAPAQHTQIGAGSDRYWYAVRLLRAGKGKKIILTGGNVYSQPGLQGEAVYAAELLREWGVANELIVVEANSRTTQQNLLGVARLLEKENIESALLVTSAMHMPRAYDLFRELPVSLVPASADVLVRDYAAPEIFKWIPSAKALQLMSLALHEYYGRWFNSARRSV